MRGGYERINKSIFIDIYSLLLPPIALIALSLFALLAAVVAYIC